MNQPNYGEHYAPPPSHEEPEFGGSNDYLGDPQSVPAGNCTGWIGNAWALFKAQWLKWIAASVIFFVIIFGISLIPLPYLTDPITSFLATLLGAGFIYAAHQTETEGEFQIGDIFAAFSHPNAKGLFILGGIQAAFSLLVLLGGVAVGLPMEPNDSDPYAMMNASVSAMMTYGLLVMVLSILFYIAIYLASPLILLQGESLPDAVKLSLKAFGRNVAGAVLCSLLCFLLLIGGAIPLGLGLLVVLPMVLMLPYVVYRDLFFAD